MRGSGHSPPPAAPVDDGLLGRVQPASGIGRGGVAAQAGEVTGETAQDLPASVVGAVAREWLQVAPATHRRQACRKRRAPDHYRSRAGCTGPIATDSLSAPI